MTDLDSSTNTLCGCILQVSTQEETYWSREVLFSKEGLEGKNRHHSTTLSSYAFQRKLSIVAGFHKSMSASISRCASIWLIRHTDNKGRPSLGSIELEDEFKLIFKAGDAWVISTASVLKWMIGQVHLSTPFIILHIPPKAMKSGPSKNICERLLRPSLQPAYSFVTSVVREISRLSLWMHVRGPDKFLGLRGTIARSKSDQTVSGAQSVCNCRLNYRGLALAEWSQK
jgi:hypothetical protein